MDNNHLAGDIPASLANLTSLVNPGQAWVDHGDGLDLGYNRLNVLNYPDPLGTFLQQKDPNWYLSQSRSCYLPMVKK